MPARKTTDGRTPDGKWIDRWVESGRRRQRTFDRKGDRDAFRDRRRRAQQLGREVASELMLDDDVTLNAWMEDWWARHAIPNLESQTRVNYKRAWGKWIQPRLGSYELRALTPRVINVQLVQAMRSAGAGEPTVRVALALLQSILRLACHRGAHREQSGRAHREAVEPARRAGWIRSRRRSSRRCAAQRSRVAARSARWTRSSSACSPTRACAPRSCWRCTGRTCWARRPSCSSRARTSTASCFPYLKSGRKRRNRATAASTSSSRSPPTSARTA